MSAGDPLKLTSLWRWHWIDYLIDVGIVKLCLQPLNHTWRNYLYFKILNLYYKFVFALAFTVLLCIYTFIVFPESYYSCMYFQLSGKRGIPVENIQILNTRSIKLHLPKLSVGDDGVYTCYLKTFSGDTRIFGSQIIEVDCMYSS